MTPQEALALYDLLRAVAGDEARIVVDPASAHFELDGKAFGSAADLVAYCQPQGVALLDVVEEIGEKLDSEVYASGADFGAVFQSAAAAARAVTRRWDVVERKDDDDAE